MNRHARRAEQAQRAEAIKRANAKLRSEMRAFYGMIDDGLTPTLPANVSCTKGCAGCCRQLIMVTLIEAMYIVATHPERVRRALPHLREQSTLLERAAGSRDALKPSVNQELCDAWWDAGASCVFLEGNLCSVYDVRPFPCRTYYVTSAPELCHAEEVSHVAVLRGAWYEQGALRLLGATVETFGQGAYGHLPMMLRYAWELAHGDGAAL